MYPTQTQISLNDVRLYGYHGVLDQERSIGAWYRVSVTVSYPFHKALDSDDLSDTINYAELLSVINKQMQIPSQLLEHLAGRIARNICEEFPKVTEITLTVTKENPPLGADTSGASVLLSVKNDINIR